MFLVPMLMFVFVACTDFYDRFKHHSEKCKEAIQDANNRQESKDVTALLAYEPTNWHTIPSMATNLAKASLPPCTSKIGLRDE